MVEPLYPDITVPLTGEDGNAWFIVGRVSAALKAGGVHEDIRMEFQREALSGNYDHVLRTVTEWVDVT